MSSSWAFAFQSRELIKGLEAIQDFPRLQDVSGLSGFLGLISSVVHSNGKRILLPLTSALRGRKKHLLEWFLVMMNSFNAAKTVLYNTV
jgi:hypothetical protein